MFTRKELDAIAARACDHYSGKVPPPEPFPETVRVGAFDYAVELWPATESSAAERFGECDRNNLVIRVAEILPRVRRVEVLLHEVLRAAFEAGDLNDGETEEKIVTVLANQLTAIWRDNPDLVRFVEETFRPPCRPVLVTRPMTIDPRDYEPGDIVRVVDEDMAERAHDEAQRQSFVRGMTTGCEHGALDFEQCPKCRGRI